MRINRKKKLVPFEFRTKSLARKNCQNKEFTWAKNLLLLVIVLVQVGRELKSADPIY